MEQSTAQRAHTHLRVFAHYVLGRLAFLFFLCHPGSMATFADSKDFLQQRYPNRELLVDLTNMPTADDIRSDIKHRQFQSRAGGKTTAAANVAAVAAADAVSVSRAEKLIYQKELVSSMKRLTNNKNEHDIRRSILASASSSSSKSSNISGGCSTISKKQEQLTEVDAIELVDRQLLTSKRARHIMNNHYHNENGHDAFDVEDDDDRMKMMPCIVEAESRQSVHLMHKRKRNNGNNTNRGRSTATSPFSSTKGLAFIRPVSSSPLRGRTAANNVKRPAAVARSLSPEKNNHAITMLLGFNLKRNGGSGSASTTGNNGEARSISTSTSSSSATALNQGAAAINMDTPFLTITATNKNNIIDSNQSPMARPQKRANNKRMLMDNRAPADIDEGPHRPLVSVLMSGALNAYDNALNYVGCVLITSPISSILNFSPADESLPGTTRQPALTTPASIARGAVLQDTYDLVGFSDLDPYVASGRLNRGGGW